MKNFLTLIALTTFSSLAISAEDGTGQGKTTSTADSFLFGYCNSVIKAEDGTGQNKAEDGTGQNKYTQPALIYCKQLIQMK